MWLKLMALAGILYVAVTAAAYVMQTKALFPTGAVNIAERLPASTERIEIMSTSGHRLRGLYIPAALHQPARTIILGFGGNAWNAENAAMYLHGLYPAAEIIAFHYRGYSPSEGQPSAAALAADAPLVFDYARLRFGDAPTIAVGFSIGSGVAASLAPNRPLAGAILVTPFNSLATLASAHYRWLPIRLILRHQLDAAADVAKVRTPIAIIAAERDRLIPSANTDAFRRVVPNLVFDRIIAGAGHNDMYQNPEFRRAMQEALERVLATEIPT